jgi:membrane-bound lytic murein transglycosylase A
MTLERRKLLEWVASLGCVLWLVCGCTSTTTNPPESPQAKQLWLSAAEPLAFTDDLDRDSLRLALQRSVGYLRCLPPARLLPFGDRQVTVSRLLDTLQTFQQALEQAPTPEALGAAVAQHFEAFQASGRDHQGEVLFTGYYEMLLDGSLHPAAEFPYPLYSPPPDMLHIDLGLFRRQYKGERLIARYDHGNVLPYFTRREIDTEGKLRGRGLELAWLRDAVDGFFLHVQGSGQLRLPSGRTIYVTYASSNGHPYRSIGRLLLQEGQLSPESLSLQALRQYLRSHPDERRRVLNANPRYIFFSQVERGPKGSLNFVLVPGRSIATDATLFPPAGLAFIQTQQPIIDAQGTITGWKQLHRFVFNHDKGSAITGPGRVDLFWGSGTRAELAAGHLKHAGKLFFLLKRHPQSTQPEVRSY